ncbi:ATP-binding protein [Acuticoccus sp. MNP-M23]|uniref:ATP-binding protein n=1 Tax=Acuticoccus sp. MNP-M23 TaxID=3072793 RepID=UPI0028155234|nr:ATP-binding protein [Acuticoccus sp. MNP-M23]WMS41709.1 ATP-binding protein [Acuticoccus sp. MNP-M23]
MIALIATGVVLSTAFRETVEERFDETLNVYLSILIGQLADPNTGTIQQAMPTLGDPRFMLPLSGWYWTVLDVDKQTILMASDSLAGDVVVIPEAMRTLAPGAVYQGYVTGPTSEPLRAVAQKIAIEDGQWLLAMVSGDSSSIAEDTAVFAARLAIFLGIFAAILVAITFIQWRVSLRPLHSLRREIEAVQDGAAARVGTEYPREIAPMAEALNTLIDTNRATLERARRHVGNLAHALKTPLSVMMNDAASDTTPLARSVREQTQIMQRQLRYYLERAQMAAKERMIGASTDVESALERLYRAMSRLGERRGIDVSLEISEPLKFAGERQDFEEIVGNLVDNGLKWAKERVLIAVVPAKTTLMGRANMMRVTIEDDGPGLTVEQRRRAMARGQRLDQSKPGSGLGLSIVSELVELYGGTLDLESSPLGGLKVVITLPRG